MNKGDMLLVNYTIVALEEGRERVVDTTIESIAREAGIYDPNRTYREATIVYGKSPLLPAVEEALAEMSVGERREIIAPPEKAYGERREDLVVRVPLKQLQRLNIRPRVGEEIEIGGRRGVISKITERFAYIDMNHPLAGKTLKITLEIMKKVETIEDKARILAARMLGLHYTSVGAEYDGQSKTLKIILPQGVLGLTDLEARLSAIAADIYEVLEPKKLLIIIEVEYPEKVEKREEASQPSTQQ
ncbi:MAG: peptidylprolyl isomerase [Acidilobaceae archaeon]